MIEWAALKAFLTSPLFKYGAIALLVAGLVGAIYLAGQRHVQIKWDEAKQEVKTDIAEHKADASAVTTEVVTKYVDRVTTVKVKGDTVIKYVDRYITKESDAKCVVPNNAVLLIDAAAKNLTPTPLAMTTSLSMASTLVKKETVQ